MHWKGRLMSLLKFAAALAILSSLLFAQDAARPGGWVVLPVGDYANLRARAYPVLAEPKPATPDAVITRVDYDLEVRNEIAAGTASLTVDVLADGWVQIPIPSGLLVRDAKTDTRFLSLVPDSTAKGAGVLKAVLTKRGRTLLQLGVTIPVVSAGGQERVVVPASASAVTRLSITLPLPDADATVTGGVVASRNSAATAGKLVAYGRGGEPMNIVWRRRVEHLSAALPLRMRGSLTELVALGEETASLSAEVDLEITQGAAKQVRVQVPAGVTINQVLGAGVGDWELKPGELVVTFLQAVPKSAKFVVAGEAAVLREGAINIPLLRPLDLERDNGGVAVEVLGAGEIKEVTPVGLESVDPSDLGQVIAARQSPSLAAFRARPGKDARSLTVQVVRYAQQSVLTANVEEARYRALASSEGKILVQAHYAVRNSQKNFVRITLPAGAVLWSAAANGRTLRPGKAPDGSFLLPLNKTGAGEDAPSLVEILYLLRDAAWPDKGQARLPLPSVDMPVSRTGLVLYYPPLYRVTAEPGAFRGEPYTPPSSPVLSGNVPVSAARGTAPASGIRESQAQMMQQASGLSAQNATQTLIDEYRERSDRARKSVVAPIRVSFPAVGPSLFLVSELTAENQPPTVTLNYQKDRKASAR